MRFQYDVSSATAAVRIINKGYFLSPRRNDATATKVFSGACIRLSKAQLSSIEPLPDLAFS
jgi:hypothetical protein